MLGEADSAGPATRVHHGKQNEPVAEVDQLHGSIHKSDPQASIQSSNHSR